MQLLVAFLLLCTISPSWQQAVTSGYVTKTEYSLSGCSNTTAIRTMSFKVNSCNPTFSVIARYNPAEDKPFSLQYFSDSLCQSPTNQAFYTELCEIGTSVATTFKYSSSLPATAGLYSYAAYDPSTNACDGDIFFFQQNLPVCYLNNYGDYISQRDTCEGTTGTTVRCYDTECKNCTIDNPVLSNICDPISHSRSSCGAPASSDSTPSPSLSPSPSPSSSSTGQFDNDPSTSSAFSLSPSYGVMLVIALVAAALL